MINVYFSYDYELMWGVWPFKTTKYFLTNVANANAALAASLVAHQSAEIPANVAIVGALLDNSQPRKLEFLQTLNKGRHAKLKVEIDKFPQTRHLWKISAWLVRSLQSNPWVEIGSHSYSHIFADEASSVELEIDFARQAITFKNTFGCIPRFLVLPKNQMTPEIYKIADRYEFKEIRVNSDNWLSDPMRRGIGIRILRFLDSYFPIQEMMSCREYPNLEPKLLEGRFFFRPVHTFFVLDWLHFMRLKIGYFHCRTTGRDFHIWTHPHNMGHDVWAAQKNLKRIFRWLKSRPSGEVQFCRMAAAEPVEKRATENREKQAI